MKTLKKLFICKKCKEYYTSNEKHICNPRFKVYDKYTSEKDAIKIFANSFESAAIIYSKKYDENIDKIDNKIKDGILKLIVFVVEIKTKKIKTFLCEGISIPIYNAKEINKGN